VQQLLHAPKVPPATGKGRRRKLQFTLQVTEAGSGAAVPVGQVLQQAQERVRQVAVVTPGRKYWLAARLSCSVSCCWAVLRHRRLRSLMRVTRASISLLEDST
jgi:hypothetical protein